MKPSPNPTATVTALRQRPPAPEHLNDAAKSYWESIVASLAIDFFLDHDLILLSQYCRALAAADHARTQLEALGPINPKSGKVSPWVGICATETRSVHTFSVRLRLCAQSRIDRAAAGLKARPPAGPRSFEKTDGLARYGL